MAHYTEIFSVSNSINKLHNLSNFHYVYQKYFFRDKQKEMDEIFDE